MSGLELSGCRHGRLAVCQRAVPQAAQGERHAHVAHAQFGAGELKELGGPVRAAGGPALPKHEEGVLHQNLHTHLESSAQSGKASQNAECQWTVCFSDI